MIEWIAQKRDKAWLYCEEQLASGHWLACFKPAPNYAGAYWVNVLVSQWSASPISCPTVIEEHLLDDEFIQLCIIHEMRKKYGAQENP